MILAIEDEPGIVDFVERGLRRQGFEVISVADGDRRAERARWSRTSSSSCST